MQAVETDCASFTITVDFRYRYASSTKSRSLYRKLLAAVLARSKTLELDISIKAAPHGERPPHYYDLLSPHLSRAHTLDVEMGNFAVDLIPVSCIPELGKLRHFYAKGEHDFSQVVLPPSARNAPLKTFYYLIPSPLCMSSVPQAELQTVTFCLYDGVDQAEDLVKLVNNSRLQKLELKAWTWDTKTAISSPTLIHLDIQMVQSPVSCLLGQLPNLLHLRLTISTVYDDGPAVISTSLPSLRSLYLKTSRKYGPFLKFIIPHAPQLVALQIGDADAREAIDLFRGRWDKNDSYGATRESLRLVRVVVPEPFLLRGTRGDLSELALILHAQRPHVQTEWYSLAHDGEMLPPVMLDGIEATLVSEEPSPPLFKCADEIIGASGI